MKAATTLITLFVALAAAGVVPRTDKSDKHHEHDKQHDNELEMPGCAKKCAHNFWQEGHCKSEDDNACLCSSEAFHMAVAPCIQEKCDDKDEMDELHSFILGTCGQMTWGGKEEPVSKPAPMPQPMPEMKGKSETGYGY